MFAAPLGKLAAFFDERSILNVESKANDQGHYLAIVPSSPLGPPTRMHATKTVNPFVLLSILNERRKILSNLLTMNRICLYHHKKHEDHPYELTRHKSSCESTRHIGTTAR